ncbi:MAG: pseudouridine synthase [Acidobacteria bacterium]|nr:pseudouridine synthase [Acidobacteriota bacterium]MBV9185343.1 pseudouridine synthase [Acidobacteriota bacterium]
MQERLQKIIAHAGVSSRREAEAMIREGRVTLNGRVVEELGTRADPDRDHIKVDGKLITKAEPHRYILLYKPKEVMTTVEDPQGRRTVIDLVRGIRERIYPVGRLDFHSEGLVLLTNDGELAFKVSHPTHGSVKTYSVKVRGVPEERLVDKLRRGITIDGKRTLPCDIERMHTTGKRDDEGNSWFEVKLREGRTQQIRKMFQAVGHPVSKLRRVAIGPISDPKLTPGVWRELTKQEVKMLETMKEPKKTVKPRRTAARPTSRKKPAAAASRKPAASRAKPAAKRSASSRTETRSSTRRTPSPRPATPRPKVASGKSSGSKKPAVRRAGARSSRSSARR